MLIIFMDMKKISRRRALRQLGALGLATGFLPHVAFSRSQERLKIGIRGGQVLHEGRLKPLFVGVTSANRLQVSEQELPAAQIIEASGKIVSPGFIDILADNAGNPERSYATFEKYKLSDGLTSVLQMHGCMADTAAWHRRFDALPHYVNYGGGVFVMLIRMQYTQLAQRLRQVEKCLAEGALGVCHSIEYQPTPYSELVAYGRLACKYKRPFFLHLRYSAEATELKGVQEAIQLAKDTEAHIHIAHLHSTGGTYHMAKALALIEEARKQGLRITACVYPYSYWATYLASKRFDEGWQQRFNISYEDLTVVGTGERLNAKTFQQYRQRQGLLVAVPEGTMPLDKTVDLALQTDFCIVGSDGGIESEARANNHPRGAACFATFIRHGLNIGLSMPQILAKITTLPRQLLLPALKERGEIASGHIADLTIFDAARIQGKASVANPNQFSEGIEAVVLNGTLVYQQKKLLAQKGQPIRYSS